MLLQIRHWGAFRKDGGRLLGGEKLTTFQPDNSVSTAGKTSIIIKVADFLPGDSGN